MKRRRMMAIAGRRPGVRHLPRGVLVIVVGGWRVMEGAITIGALAAFYSYVLTMWSPVRWLTFVNQMAQQAMASGERIFEILDTPLDVTEQPDAVVLPRLAGRLELDRVSFAYGKARAAAAGRLATVEPGQTLALVGPSGSGKTHADQPHPPLLRRLRRARCASTATTCATSTLESLRSQIGMVMQETFLFNLTIRENISYGRADATARTR